jgi:enoyl-CoA hydratase/carnithine racemase
MSDVLDDEGAISVEQQGHVLLMGLNRPAKLNGMTPTMFRQLVDAYTRLEADPDLWVGVLHAHGDHFTAGLDLPKFVAAMSANGGDMTGGTGIDPFALRAPWRAKPVIAAVKGITFTAGLELALAADIIIAGEQTRFAMMEPKRGLMPTGGATVRFVERGGWGNAMRWLLTGDEFDAEEARRIGIVQEIVPNPQVLERALALAQTVATRAPLAVQAARRNALTYAQQGEAAAIAQFASVQQGLARSADFAEGVQSFIERRAARFEGR